MSIRSFVVACLLGFLLLSSGIVAVILVQQDRSRDQHAAQVATAELVNTALHGSFLLFETQRAPARAGRQWRRLHEQGLDAIAELDAIGKLPLAQRMQEHFQRIDELFQDYAAGYLREGVNQARQDWLQRTLRGRLAMLAGEAEVAHRVANDDAASSRSVLSLLLLLTATVLPVLLLSLLLYLQRKLLPDIAALVAATERIEEGDYERPVDVHRSDEVGQLSATMERMRRSLLTGREEIERKNALLQAKSEEVEAFVYAVSHDLRGPLVNLVGFTHELELTLQSIEGSDGELHPDQIEDMRISIRFVSDNAQRLEALIEALLRLSRTGRQDLHPQEVDATVAAREVVDSLRDRLRAVDATVELADLPSVYADPLALARILDNLLVNAIKYHHPDRPLRIAITGADADDTASIAVTDNGLGFPATADTTHFQAFQRYHPERAEGEGMGLLIVKRLAERSGGELTIASTSDAGTTMRVLLPYPPQPDEAS